jgi:hypothetical protein
LRSGLEGLAILLIAALLLPLYTSISLALEPSTSIESNLPASQTQPRTQAPQSNAYKFVTLALPVKLLRNLVGVSIKSIVASPCYDDTLVIVPYVLPKRFMRSFMPSLNATVLLPDLGDGVLTEDDVLILEVPIPIGRATSARCGWAVHVAKSGLRERYLVTLRQGMQVTTEKGLEALQNPITIAIYFDKNQSRKSLIYGIPFDVEALKTLSKALGVQLPEQPRLVHDFNATEIIETENAWNNWLKNIRSRVAVEANNIARTLTATYERRAGFVYDPLSDRVVAEIEFKEVEKAAYQQLKDVYQQAYLIDGGGGPSQLYDFTFIIGHRTRVSYSTKNIYLGYNVYSIAIYVRANSTTTSTAYLGIDVRLIDTDTKSVVWSNSYSYSLGPQPQDIYIFPSIPFDTTRRFNITITFRWSGGAQPYIIHSTLKIHKVWDKMPIEQTVKGYQILSVGIATLRNPWSGELPLGCQRARASDMLDQSVYGLTTMKQGIIIYSPIKAVSIDASLLNGLFYDPWSKTSPVLYIDICIRNPYSNSVSGTINIKINGVTYASQSLTVYPLPPFGYAGFTLLLGANPVKGHGHIITIEHNFPPYVELYIDAVIEYRYAPEVWKETSYYTWFGRSTAWFKLYLPQHGPISTVYKSALVVEAGPFAYDFVRSQGFRVRYLVTSENISNAKILGVTLAFKPASSYPDTRPSCNITTAKGTRYDKYVGLATTAVGLMATGIDIATYLGIAIPEPVSKGISLAAFVSKILYKALVESKTLTQSPDEFYVCTWSPGINSYVTIEMHISISYDQKVPDTTYYIRLAANGAWALKPITINMPMYSYNTQIYRSYHEVYPGFYGRDPVWDMIYYS